MKTFFISLDFWDIINDKYKALTKDEDYKKLLKEYKKKDAMALHFIHQGVGETTFPCILDVMKAKDVWQILKQEFQEKENTIVLNFNLW